MWLAKAARGPVKLVTVRATGWGDLCCFGCCGVVWCVRRGGGRAGGVGS